MRAGQNLKDRHAVKLLTTSKVALLIAPPACAQCGPRASCDRGAKRLAAGTLQTFEVALQTTVYFAATHGLERNLLGRTGWLHQVKLGIVDHDELIYLSHYDEP